MDEFLKQLKHWRGITEEYISRGSVNFETSVREDSSYGTRNNTSTYA